MLLFCLSIPQMANASEKKSWNRDDHLKALVSSDSNCKGTSWDREEYRNVPIPKYMTKIKAEALIGLPNILKTKIDGKEELVGGAYFQFDGADKRTYIPSEAPLNNEGFLQTIIDHNIGVYVSLTKEADNNKNKLIYYRLSEKKRVDMHHLYKLNNKTYGRFTVKDVKIVSNKDDIANVYVGTIVDNVTKAKKQIYHVRFNKWPDAGIISSEDLDKLVDLTKKYAGGDELALFANCYAGIGRTRTLISAFHAKTLLEKNIKIDADEIADEFFEKNYSEDIKKHLEGRDLHVLWDKGPCGTQRNALRKYVEFLTSKKSS